MDDEIGIAANRRGEMRVVLGGQPEVAEARRVVPRLLHRPQHQRRDRPLLRGAAHAVDQLLEVLDRKSTRLNSSHSQISYAVFCLKKKKKRTFADLLRSEWSCVAPALVRSLLRVSQRARTL